MSTFQKTHSKFSYTIETQLKFKDAFISTKKDILQKFMKTWYSEFCLWQASVTVFFFPWTFFSDGGLESGQKSKVVVSNIFYFHTYLGEMVQFWLYNIFQMGASTTNYRFCWPFPSSGLFMGDSLINHVPSLGWNHQPEIPRYVSPSSLLLVLRASPGASGIHLGLWQKGNGSRKHRGRRVRPVMATRFSQGQTNNLLDGINYKTL